jgi:prophage regulatory protein
MLNADVNELLKLNEVQKLVHYSKPSIYRLMKAGSFPTPIKLGGRSIFWIKSDIEKFIQKCIEKSRREEA